MDAVYFLVVLISCSIGAISGIGGGIIIRPVIDSMKTMPLVVINFLSSASVLAMAIVSVIANRKSDIRLEKHITIPLAIGSSIGGVVARAVFNILRTSLDNDVLLSLIQSAILLSMNAFILFYFIFKNRIKTYSIKNVIASLFIGFFLSLLSSFLGLGGGPVNMAILYYFYSMDAKKAALNSLFIIVISQSTSVGTTILSNNVPSFSTTTLLSMCFAAVIGAFIGRGISKKIDNKAVERIFITLLFVLITLNIYNITFYSSLL